jgi:hypothetical protein
MQERFNATRIIVLAGIAGGTVEVVWVALFCLMSPLQSSLVAEEITRSFLPQFAGVSALATGLIIHYALAVLVAGMIAMILLRLLGDRIDVRSVLTVSAAALAAIWVINFFLILPVVNPDFVTLMPYAVTLASKLGFGIAMGWVFWRQASAGLTKHTTHRRLALR